MFWVFCLLKSETFSGDLIPLFKYFYSDPRDIVNIWMMTCQITLLPIVYLCYSLTLMIIIKMLSLKIVPFLI
uniref:Uncharacterized protein n=1 Tax=Rhizophora mucronata TaxID=61149 RepID=A0A2P2NYP8_RHIMU